LRFASAAQVRWNRGTEDPMTRSTMTRSTMTTAALVLLATGSILSQAARAQDAVEPEVPGVASSSDMGFTHVPPCPLLDTRLAGGGIAAHTQRAFLVTAANLSGHAGSA